MTGYAVAAPRVFISYSHDSPQHEGRVLALSDRLRVDGVDAALDQYEASPREGWPRWTERQIEDADFVLLICTETYLRRVQDKEDQGIGRGVVWEANLIYNHIHAGGSAASKFVPVLLDPGGESFIPTPVKGVTHYIIADESGYEALYRHLTNQPAAVRTALGEIHSLPPKRPRSYPASHHASRVRQAPRADDERNRRKMLARVHHDWIQGVLERSLYKVARLDLIVSSAPEAVEKRFPIGVEPRDRADNRLNAAARIGDVFDEHVGALLILGAPGAGKTTLLLELAHTLQKRAEHDHSVPIPVIFNLSSWSLRRPSFADWLVDELNERYDMPRSMAQQWLDDDQILPLLDGLDEVAAADRDACVGAMNEFRRQNGLLPIAVCSRAAEYASLSARLRLPAAVVVQPLTRSQVVDYLERAGAPLDALREAAMRDPSILELLDTPLALDIVRLALDSGQDPLQSGHRSGVGREQFVASYVEGVFRRRIDRSSYQQDLSREWLVRLAAMMTRQSQTTFHLESLRPEWLASARQCRVAAVASWIAIALLGAAFFPLTDAAFLAAFEAPEFVWSKELSGQYLEVLRTVYNPFNPFLQLLFGAGVASVAALTTGRAMSGAWSWNDLRQSASRGFAWGGVAGARLGIAVGAIVGLVWGFAQPMEGHFILRFIFAPVVAVVAGTIDAIQVAILSSLAGLLVGVTVAIVLGPRFDQVVVKPTWSSRMIGRTVRTGLWLGLRIGALSGVLAVIVVAFADPTSLQGGIDAGMTGLVIAALVFAIMAGLGGSVYGALLGVVAGLIVGAAFIAPTLPSIRPLWSSLRELAGSRRDVRPVDRVRWSWSEPRNGFEGAVQFSMLGGILGAVFLGSMSALSGVLEPFLGDTILDPIGSVSIESAGQLERVVFAFELVLIRGLSGALMGAVVMALSLGPLGFIEGMLVKTDLVTRSAPNEGTIRSVRAALITSLCVGLIFALIQVPIALLTIATMRGLSSAAEIGGQQTAVLSAVSGAQIGMLCAAVRNGGLFCVQHFVVRTALWWTGSAPWQYTRFLDHAAQELALLRKVGGGYIFTHRLVLNYFASLPEAGKSVGGVPAPSDTATV